MSKAIQKWQSSGEQFSYNRHSIFYKDVGKGEVLICIHGFPTCSWDWHLMWPELAKRYRVIAPDMIGFGFSDKPAGYNYSIFDQADLFETLLSDLDINTFHILAHDYGVSVAQEMLARKLEKPDYFDIKSVCFLNGGMFSESYKPLLIQKLLMSPIGGLLGQLLSKRSLKRSFQKIFGPNTQPIDEEIDEWWYLINYNNGKRVIHKVIRYMQERAQHHQRWTDAVVKSSIPMRLINGPEDPISGINMANKYKEIVPNADVVLLDGMGHYPQKEAAEKVLEHLR